MAPSAARTMGGRGTAAQTVSDVAVQETILTKPVAQALHVAHVEECLAEQGMTAYLPVAHGGQVILGAGWAAVKSTTAELEDAFGELDIATAELEEVPCDDGRRFADVIAGAHSASRLLEHGEIVYWSAAHGEHGAALIWTVELARR